MGKKISRRSFMKGTAAGALGLASLGLMGGAALAEEAPQAKAINEPDQFGSHVQITLFDFHIVFSALAQIGERVDEKGDTGTGETCLAVGNINALESGVGAFGNQGLDKVSGNSPGVAVMVADHLAVVGKVDVALHAVGFPFL